MLGFSQLSRSGFLVEAVTFLDEAVAPDDDLGLLALGGAPDSFGGVTPVARPSGRGPSAGAGWCGTSVTSADDPFDASAITVFGSAPEPAGAAVACELSSGETSLADTLLWLGLAAALTEARGAAARLASGTAPLTEGRSANCCDRDAEIL